MFGACLFDFDGTLVDSMSTFGAMALRILDEHKISYGEDIIKIVTPLGYGGMAQYFRQLGIEMEQDALIQKMIDYVTEDYRERIEAKPYVCDVLRALKEKGVSLNVLTASPHSVLDPCLKRLGIFDLFDNVWSSDDLGTIKADPKIYAIAAEKIGLPIDRVLFVDDNLGALQSAKRSGIRTCGVYDPSSEDYREEIRQTADYYANDFSELKEIAE